MTKMIGFLGAGKMAGALAKGFRDAGLVSDGQLMASDIYEPARSQFAADTGASVTADNREVAAFSEILFLAVKPAQIEALLAELKDAVHPGQLVVSIAAGVPLKRLEAGLPSGCRVVRVMPNTPALVGASASAFALGTHATPEDSDRVKRLLSAVGIAVQLDEKLMDAVTGLSGSGPAYGYLMIEALSDGGVAAGLPRDLATQLAAQTLLGSAQMVLKTGLHPGVLKDMVTSPGGTTIEGVHELESGGLRCTLMNAVRAATEKSHQLGQS